MAMPRVFTFIGGRIKAAVLSIQISAGAADADKIIATNADGKLDPTFLPAGVGAATISATTSEAISAGKYVNLYSDGVGLKARNADGATNKQADGFVITAYASGAVAVVYPLGEVNTQHAGLTPGGMYFLSPDTPGGVTPTAPSTTGQMWQYLGKAVSATELQTTSSIAVEIL